MARRQWKEMSCLLVCLITTNAIAQDKATGQDKVAGQGKVVVLDPGFLEFLGEGKNVDGEYHDPLQMQDWAQQDVVDAGQQHEDKKHD